MYLDEFAALYPKQTRPIAVFIEKIKEKEIKKNKYNSKFLIFLFLIT